MAKVSVIIPVYNVEKYIEECLGSLVNQTLKDIEIIVINDGSPDNSQKIIDKYAKKDKRIVSIIQENSRIGKTRNNGLLRATGEYIAYVDSDDYVESEMLEKMYNKAKENDSDIVISAYYTLEEETNKREFVPINKKILDEPENENLKYFNWIAPWVKMCKRELLIDNNITFLEKINYEDVPFSFKLMSVTNKIAYINEPFYNYRIRRDSVMTSNNMPKNRDLMVAFDEVIDYFKKKKIYKKHYQELSFVALNEIYLSTNVRIIRSTIKKSEKINLINEFNDYMESKFSDFKNNKYIKSLSLGRKVVFHLMNNKQYWLIKKLMK